MRECIIPAYATLDEAVFYALEDTQETFNRVLEETGIEELGAFLASDKIFTEADEEGAEGEAKESKSGALKEKVMGAIDRAGQALKGLYGKFMEAIHNAQVNFRKRVADKELKAINEKIEELKKREDADKVLVSTYKFTGLAAALKGEGDAWSTVKGMIDDLEVDGESSTESNLSNVKDEIRGDKYDYKISNISKKTLNDLYKIVTDTTKVKQQLAAALKGDEARLNALKQKFKGDKGTLKDVKEACHELIKTRNITLQVYKERMDAARTVLIKLAGKHAPKAAEEEAAEPVNASATFQEELDSLFDWSAL